MFGRNPIRKRELLDGETLLLQGTPWKTIQGEGPFAGLPATFIRLWGCHLQCFFCDTDFESDQRTWQVVALAEECSGTNLVVLTGGEPLRQNIVPLCRWLLARGHKVQVETAGSFWFLGTAPDHLTVYSEFPVSLVVSPKTPKVHDLISVNACAWKYIISASMELGLEDGLPITNTQHPAGSRPKPLARPPAGTAHEQVYLQPMDEYDVQKNSDNIGRCVELALKYGYRVSLQQHKILKVL